MNYVRMKKDAHPGLLSMGEETSLPLGDLVLFSIYLHVPGGKNDFFAKNASNLNHNHVSVIINYTLLSLVSSAQPVAVRFPN